MPVVEKKRHGAASGKMVTFYIGVPEGRKKGEIVPVSINGHPAWKVVLGRENTCPEDVVKVLRNCQSSVMKNAGLEHENNPGGMGRPQSRFYEQSPANDDNWKYEDDYDIHILKEE